MLNGNWLLRACLLSFFTIFSFNQLYATAVSANGKLKVSGTQLVSECGNPVQLRGVSTHGLQYFGDCITSASLDGAANVMGADIVRIAMYVNENGYLSNPAGFTSQVDALVDQIGARGMYALIDWHILNPGDPNISIADARTFWTHEATQHKGKKYVLYEICNEPNGVSWSQIKTYADDIIPKIRAIDPDTVIICGTPNWSQLDSSISGNKLNYTNIMYTFHFYAATHSTGALTPYVGVLPIFVTEWAACQSTGSGNTDYTNATNFINIMNTNKISWCSWSYSDSTEASGQLTSGICPANGPYDTAHLTTAGTFVRTNINSPAKSFITCAIPPTLTPTNTVPQTPTYTFTFTNTVNPAYTATNTPTVPTGVCLMDDCEDGDEVDKFGGFWFTYSGGNNTTIIPDSKTTTFTMTAGGSPQSPAYAAHISGQIGYVAAPDYPSAGMGTQFNAMSGAPPHGTGKIVDISNCTGLKFYVKGDGNRYLVMIPYIDGTDTSLTQYDDWEFAFVAPAAWTQMTIPFNTFTVGTYGTPCTLNTVLKNAKNFEFQTGFNATALQISTTFSLWIDDVQLYGCSSCLAVAPTRTPTGTATLAMTNTFTKTSTPVPPTNTNTAVSTSTFTFTNTYTNTSTSIPPTYTSTNSSTATSLPTFTKTNTATYTNTAVNTSTSTLVPATSTSTMIPATSTSTMIPATSTSTVVPATNTSTVVPATNTSTDTPTKTFTNTSTYTNTNVPTPSSTYTSTMTPVPGGPDLTITGMSVTMYPMPVCILPGQVNPLGVLVNFRNAGNAAAGQFTIDVDGNTVSVSGLAAGASGSVFFSGYAPAFTTVNAVIDSKFTVTESNEANNTLSQVIPAPTQPPFCTNTPTDTVPPTATNTNTATATYTYTMTAKSTETQSSTGTATQVDTPTFTYTNTVYSAPANTNTPTVTAMATATWTPTVTNTDSIPATVTYTSVPATFTPTPTATSMFTNTSVPSTFTFTPVYTDTHVPATFTYTLTGTNTFTPTESETAIVQFTATETPIPGKICVRLISVNGSAVPAVPTIDVSAKLPASIVAIITVKPAAQTSIYLQDQLGNITVLVPAAEGVPGTTEYNVPQDKFLSVTNGGYILTIRAVSLDGDVFMSSQQVTVVNSLAVDVKPEKLRIPGDKQFFPFPNPVNGRTDVRIKFYVTNNASSVTFRMYTPALRLIRNIEVPAKMFNNGLSSTIKAGDNVITVPAEYFKGLANGSYYYFIIVKDNEGTTARSKLDKIMVIK
jgi:hypothetical protein